MQAHGGPFRLGTGGTEARDWREGTTGRGELGKDNANRILAVLLTLDNRGKIRLKYSAK